MDGIKAIISFLASSVLLLMLLKLPPHVSAGRAHSLAGNKKVPPELFSSEG